MVMPLLVWMVLARPLRSRLARVPLLVSTLTFLPLALKLWVFPFGVTLDVPPAGRADALALVAAAPPALLPVAAPGFEPAAPPVLAAAVVLVPPLAPAFPAGLEAEEVVGLDALVAPGLAAAEVPGPAAAAPGFAAVVVAGLEP